MMAPLFKYGAFGEEASLILAFVIGIGFGFFLERGGFGSARKLVSQFYLDDLAVFKVMFTAIVTAMLGVTYLSWAGVLDLAQVYLVPTYLVPQIVGGLVLGVGFVVGGYCPGTSVAAVATGRLDGVAYVLGLFGGTLLFAEIYPLVKPLQMATPMGQVTIPAYFNLPYGLVVFAVVLMAIGGFAGAAWVEKWKRGEAPSVPRPRRLALSSLTLNQRLAFGAFVLGLVALAAQPTRGGSVRIAPAELAIAAQRSADRVKAADLAGWLIEDRADFRLIDLRAPADYAAYHIPSAENIPLAGLTDAGLAPTEKVLLYGEDGVHAAQAWFLLKAQGLRAVYMLDGGLASWKEDVLFPREVAATTSEARRHNDRARAVSAHFGGQVLGAGAPGLAMPAAPPMPVVRGPEGGVRSSAPRKRKEGC